MSSSFKSLLRSTRGSIPRLCNHRERRPIPVVFDLESSKNAPLLAAEGFEILEIQIRDEIK